MTRRGSGRATRLLGGLTSFCDRPMVRGAANRICRNKTRLPRDGVVRAVTEAVEAHYREHRWEAALAAKQAKVYQRVHFRQRIRELMQQVDASDGEHRARLEARAARVREQTLTLAALDDPHEIIGHLGRYYADDMAADFNPAFFVAFRAIAHRLFKNFVRNIVVSESEPGTIRRIRALMGAEPVLLVPNHVSNADHLPLCFAIDGFQGLQPRIAAGVNLFRGLSSIILPRVNAYRIRREYIGAGSMWLTQIKWFHNPVYRRAHTEYLRLGWEDNEPLLFYPEGGRSRDGSIGKPKMGILEDVAQYVDDTGRAAHLVPVSISYTLVPEDEAIEASRTGADISHKDLISQLATLDREIGAYDSVPLHVRFSAPVRLGPDGAGLKEAVEVLWQRVRAGVVPTPTSLLAAGALERAARTPDGPVFHLTDAETAVAERFPTADRRGLATAAEIFRTRGLLAPVDAGTWRVEREPVLRQYAERIGHL